MNRTILIAEQSEIIRKGLVQIIGSFNLFDNIREVSCSTRVETDLIKTEPDILVVNPLLLNDNLPRWLSEYRSRRNMAMRSGLQVDDTKGSSAASGPGTTGRIRYFRIAAIAYSLFDDELQELFDEVIQIGDTRLKIKNKLSSLLSRPDTADKPVADETLSAREKDIVRLLAKGLSNKEISEELYISPHTVITHRKNITRKLNIKSVAGLIVYAIINGIVNVDELHGDGNV